MDPYFVLGLPKDAVLPELKASYRKLAKIHHPDLPTGSAERFRELTRAYELLLPVVKPDRPKPPPFAEGGTFFRILDPHLLEYAITFVEDTVPAKSRFKFMRGFDEFSVLFDEEKKLPFTIRVNMITIKFVYFKGKGEF